MFYIGDDGITTRSGKEVSREGYEEVQIEGLKVKLKEQKRLVSELWGFIAHQNQEQDLVEWQKVEAEQKRKSDRRKNAVAIKEAEKKAKTTTKSKFTDALDKEKEKVKEERKLREEEVSKAKQEADQEVKVWRDKYVTEHKQFVEADAQFKEEACVLQGTVHSLTDAVERFEAKAVELKAKEKEKTTLLKQEGKLLPEFRDTATSDPKSQRRTDLNRAKAMEATLDNIPPSVMVDAVLEFSKKQTSKGVCDDDTYVGQMFQHPELVAKRRKTLNHAVKHISKTWDAKMEADIKLVTNVSDVNLDFIRNYRSKNYLGVEVDLHTMKLVEEGVEFPIPTSRWSRNKEIARRAVELGLEHNADGTICTLNLVSAITRLHNQSLNEGNSLWKTGMQQQVIFSGDGLQTARGESHCLCCLRSGLLLEGYTSCYNYYPITNALGNDHYESLNAALDPHKKSFSKLISEGECELDSGETIPVDFFWTGDMAFGLSQLGLNPASSTYGNPWGYLDEAGNWVWRSDEDCYLLSHKPTPNHGEITKDNPVKCRICGFKAVCLEDIEKDKRKKYPASHTKDHLGNYLGQTPIVPLSVKKYLPPLYHCGENLIAYRFNHLIWKNLTLEQKYDVNLALKTHLGPSSHIHLPPTRGGKDEVHMCSFIGQDVCNLRATDALVHVLKVVFPDEWEGDHIVRPPPQETPTQAQKEDDEQLDDACNQFDNLYSSSDEDEPPDMDAAIEVGENLHGVAKLRSELVADSFDTAYDFLDELHKWESFEDTTEGRRRLAVKIRELGKAANESLTRALTSAAFSEYNSVIEHVLPWMIQEYGHLTMRANEQGQESAGQMLKMLLRKSCNKRRTISSYMRRKKNKDGTITMMECKVKKTATISSTEVLALKLDAMHTVNAKLTKKLRGGHKVAEMKREGRSVKRERVMITPQLNGK